MRGRKPTPTHLKLLRGSTKRIRKDGIEPVPKGDLSAPPDWFSDAQKETWEYAIQHAPAGLLRHLDRDALGVWVVAHDLWKRASMAQAKLDAGKELPFLTKTPNGMAQQSPYVGIISKQSQIMLKAASEIGFTPASRSRVVVAGASASESAPKNRFALIKGMAGN